MRLTRRLAALPLLLVILWYAPALADAGPPLTVPERDLAATVPRRPVPVPCC